MQLLAAAGEPFYSIFVNRHTIAQISIFSALFLPALWLCNAPLLTQSSPNLPIQSNGIFPIALLSPAARKPLDATCGMLRGAILQPNWESAHHHPDFV
jgi:hypothetical protein